MGLKLKKMFLIAEQENYSNQFHFLIFLRKRKKHERLNVNYMTDNTKRWMREDGDLMIKHFLI